MSIQQTKKQSDLEKRLQLLRLQVHGKQDFKVQRKPSEIGSAKITNTISDVSYLYQDLSKIGILASMAIGFQIILFFLIKNHLLNLKFF